jgi:anti-anti-sigma factor
MTVAPRDHAELSERVMRGWFVVGVAGDLDIAGAAALAARVGAAFRRGERRICVDLSQVTLIDTSGLAALVHAELAAARSGGECAIVAPPGPARRMLEQMSQAAMLRMEEDLSAVVAGSAERGDRRPGLRPRSAPDDDRFTRPRETPGPPGSPSGG